MTPANPFQLPSFQLPKMPGQTKILMMSPPEATKAESFSQNNMAMPETTEEQHGPGPIPMLSPPISPPTKVDNHATDDLALSSPSHVEDPILYPTHDATISFSQQPLFPQEDPSDTSRIVDRHVLARPAELFKDASPPGQDDYGLVLSFKSQMMECYLKNPSSWLKRERALLIADQQAQARNWPVKFQQRPLYLSPAKPQAVRKETQREKPAKVPKVTKPTVRKAPRPIRAGPIPATPGNLTKAVTRLPSATPDPAPRRAGTATRTDVDWDSLPDYCPPITTLDGKPGLLKMDWKGQPTDLSNDPHRHLLHAEEIKLASGLRLSCATYLTSKRRMFMGRLACLESGKEFRKTDAQQACNIDVNKASKLWVAFDKAQWLDKKWVEPFLKEHTRH